MIALTPSTLRPEEPPAATLFPDHLLRIVRCPTGTCELAWALSIDELPSYDLFRTRVFNHLRNVHAGLGLRDASLLADAAVHDAGVE